MDNFGLIVVGCIVIALVELIPTLFKRVRRRLVGRIRIDNEATLLTYIVRLANAVDGPSPLHPHFIANVGASVSPTELNSLAREMAAFMGISHIEFMVHVAEMDEGVAGNVGLGGCGQWIVHIGIAPNLLEHSDVVIKVLAHELSHKYLELHGLTLQDTHENELLTDIASIYLGFGAYAVSGSRYKELLRTATVGYLTPVQCAWAYNIVSELHSDRCSWFVAPNAWVSLGDAENYNNYETYKLAVEAFVKRMARLHECFEQAELELCNVEKFCLLHPRLYPERMQEMRNLQECCVNAKKRLCDVERQFNGARERVKPIVAYVAVKSDRYALSRLNDEATKLSLDAQALNTVVSSSITDADVADRWNEREAIIIDCPACGGHLRLPMGLKHIAVTCPKCKYSFDFSTLAPKVNINQKQVFKAKAVRLRRKIEGYEPILFVVALAMVGLGSGIYCHSDYYREREAWDAATKINDSIGDLRRYLRAWPEGRHAPEAKSRLETIRKAEKAALNLLSVGDVSQYLSRFPEEDAPALRAEQYAAISNAPAFTVYRDFSGVLTGNEAYYSDVTNTLMGFVRKGWRKARQQDTEAGYIAFIHEFAAMPEYVNMARARIDEFCSDYDFVCEKGDISSFERYLLAHPCGRKSDDIRKRLVLKKIENVRKSKHEVISPPRRSEELKLKLPICWYSVSNQLPYKIEVLVGNANYARGLVLESMAGGSVLMPTGTYERCVVVESSAHPAYSKSEFLAGAYGEGFHIVTRVGRGNGRDGDWDDSTIQDGEGDLDELRKRWLEFEALRKRHGLPADSPAPTFSRQK